MTHLFTEEKNTKKQKQKIDALFTTNSFFCFFTPGLFRNRYHRDWMLHRELERSMQRRHVLSVE